MTYDGCDVLAMPGWIYMQFTGLFDKNRTEIYDGDILQYRSGYYHKRVVSWNEGRARWAMTRIPNGGEEPNKAFLVSDTSMKGIYGRKGLWEVIGNIYEDNV